MSSRFRIPILMGMLLVAVSAGTGCTSNRIGNMTPKVLRRSPDGLYPIEAVWLSNQRTVRQGTLTPYVVIGMDFHPMQRVPLTTNRWETVIPIPAHQRFLNYRFKFDYLYADFGGRRADSKLSPTYQVEVVDY